MTLARSAPVAPTSPTSTDGEHLLVLHDIAVRTDDGRDLLVVDHLALRAGERVVLRGPSGSGKTMLLRTLMGRPAAGLRLHGTRETSLSRLGIVPQRGTDALHPLIPLGRQLAQVTGSTRQQARDALTEVGLTDPGLERRRPAQISGGQAQRAAVALALLTGSPLILADEPTSALDHETRDALLDLLRRTTTRDRTLVLSTHDDTVADRMAQRLLVLSGGRIVEDSAPTREVSC